MWHPEPMQPPPLVRRALRRLPPLWQSALLHARGDFAPWEYGFDPTPPAPAPGEVVGPPDFVGVGVQKAGTSWWYELILEHPGVYERPDIHKERHYLSRFCVEPFGPAEIAGYRGWFPRVEGTITGEWTPDYFAYPWVAPLLAAAAPDARILVLVRDPVERFRSGLTFRLRNGAPRTSTTVADAVRQGYYARHLRRLLAVFPLTQVLVLQYEQCRADPAAQLARTYAFLGLEAFEPDRLRRGVNVSERAKVALDPEAADRLAALYRADVRRAGRPRPVPRPGPVALGGRGRGTGVTSRARRLADLVPGGIRRAVPAEVRADLRHRTGLTVPGDLDHRPVPPAPAARGAHRPAGLRRAGGGRRLHPLVVLPGGRPPRRRPGPRVGRGRPLLLPLLHRGVRPGRGRRLPCLVPPPAGPGGRLQVPGRDGPPLGAAAAGPRRAAGPAARPRP